MYQCVGKIFHQKYYDLHSDISLIVIFFHQIVVENQNGTMNIALLRQMKIKKYFILNVEKVINQNRRRQSQTKLLMFTEKVQQLQLMYHILLQPTFFNSKKVNVVQKYYRLKYMSKYLLPFVIMTLLTSKEHQFWTSQKFPSAIFMYGILDKFWFNTILLQQ